MWEKLGEGLAEKWLLTVFSPAFIFWIGGLFAYRSGTNVGFDQLQVSFENQSLLGQLIWILVFLSLVIFSATIVQYLQEIGVQIAEGYWPRPLRKLRFTRASNWKEKISKKHDEWQSLQDAVTSTDVSKRRQLEAELLMFPVEEDNFMPTLFGNLMRATEEYPSIRYGLDAVVCWPRLYLLFPEETREEIDEAREKINQNARLLIWSTLFLVWALWWPWAILTIIVLWIAYRGMVLAGRIYGDLVRASFDLYRFDIYRALGWPLPERPLDEELCGKQLTEYLYRGVAPEDVLFNIDGAA